MTSPQHGSIASLETMGDRSLLSETSAGNTGVWEKGCEDPGALGPADHVSDLHVQLHELGADFSQAMVRPHQGISTRLSQCLVTEINIQECLDLIIRAASKDVIGPQASALLDLSQCFAKVIVLQALQHGLDGCLSGCEGWF